MDDKRDRSTYPVRVHRLGEEPADDYSVFSPAERVAMVWELTRTAWAFKEGQDPDARLRRDVVRVVRGGS